ncbi:MAG: VOC family protein [Clostridia bacterium]|nr:VOC family protein [Clostridia bacterium]
MDQDFQIVAGLSHAAIRTRSMPDSVRFYTKVLGLREAFRMHREDGTLGTVYLFLAAGQYLELFAGGVRESLAGQDVIGICHLCLMTRDIQKSYAAVKRAGGPIDREIQRGKSRCWMFWTHDPDGTPIEIMEMPPESMQAQADRLLAADDREAGS